ncbi:hypothetical protein H8E88_14035 [candidate division KSB1 bacterium]|nr:hypothetical protein [candidate division KSB1 bacterium]
MYIDPDENKHKKPLILIVDDVPKNLQVLGNSWMESIVRFQRQATANRHSTLFRKQNPILSF